MLLRPATPLTILLLVAFVLLLLSCLSTPIIKGIPLATFDNVDYGVFGFCQGSTCSNIQVGYTGSDIGKNSKNFNLPSGTRQSLSSILIVHPVAAFLTLVCFCLAIAAHFHAPSHSPRFLLALLILLLPTLLVSLLAFLVDILLFVPHLQWGGWIVLVATIILVSCGVVTCAMRRTLVSRKARKRRIAENAEMSGENYYNRQNTAPAALASGSAPPGEAKEPVVSNSSTSEANPSYAHFRSGARDSDDDRTPLNSSLTSSTRLTDVPGSDGQYPSRRGTPYRGPQDEAGLPPSGPYGAGMMYDPSDPRSRQQYPDGGMGPRRGGGPPGFGPRGRGGYPPRGGYGRGGPYMGPRGPPGARGGWGPRGGRGGPMPGRGPSRGGMGYAPGAGLSFDSYGRPVDDPYELPGSGPMGPMREPSPASIGMAMSPEIIGQAIEMQPQSRGYEGSDSMASTLDDSHPHALSVEGQVAPLESPSSQYSRRESYVPARAGWGPNDSRQNLSPRHIPSPAPPTGHGTDYYEDVDPRFARRPSPVNDPLVPHALTPGAPHY